MYISLPVLQPAGTVRGVGGSALSPLLKRKMLV